MLFWIILGALALYVLAEFGSAYLDGCAFEWQLRMQPKMPHKFGTFWWHGGMQGDFWIVNPIIAYIISKHAHSWPLVGFVIILAIVMFAGAALLIPMIGSS